MKKLLRNTIASVFTLAILVMGITVFAEENHEFTYTGSEITPVIRLQDGDTFLVSGTDYDLSYENNVNVGTANIIVTYKGNYTGTKTVPFDIVAKTLSNDDITITGVDANCVYTGSAFEPTPTVTEGDFTLVEGTDYDISYENNINVGTATIKLTFKGNYTGEAATTFEITAKALSEDIFESDRGSFSAIEDQTFTGSPIEAKPTIVVDGLTLVEGTDYDLTYENNTNVGTTTIKATFKGNYSGEATTTFVIVTKDFSDILSIADIPDTEYNKEDICPEPKIKAGDTVLVKDADYTLTYENNRNAGTATMTVTGIGNYSGSADKTFTITPRDGDKYTVVVWEMNTLLGT